MRYECLRVLLQRYLYLLSHVGCESLQYPTVVVLLDMLQEAVSSSSESESHLDSR